MTLRKIRGSVVLGLLASLAAHMVLYGGQHAVGGAFHDLLMQVTSAAALGFVVLLAVLAWTQSGNAGDGSILATRLRAELPSFESVIASTALWYAAIEAVEPHHVVASVLALVLAIVAASYAVMLVARAVANAIARAVIAISGTLFSPRLPMWRRRQLARATARHALLAYSRFARPPPGFSRP